MAGKTTVVDNRVTIDDYNFDVKPHGGGNHTVYDEFGGKLGTFVVEGKQIRPEDYEIPGAPPILTIAKAWLAATSQPVTKPLIETHLVCRVCTHDAPEPAEAEKVKAYFDWLKSQPGIRSVVYAHSPETGKGMSMTVWESKEQMLAMKSRTPPVGTTSPRAHTVEVLQLVRDYSTPAPA